MQAFGYILNNAMASAAFDISLIGNVITGAKGIAKCQACRQKNKECKYANEIASCMSCTFDGLACGPKYTVDQDPALLSVMTPFEVPAIAAGTVATSLNPANNQRPLRSVTPSPFAPNPEVREVSHLVPSGINAGGLWEGKKISSDAIGKRYVRRARIGTGAYGFIYEVLDTETNEKFAFKIARMEVETRTELDALDSICRSIPRNLHVISVYEIWRLENSVEQFTIPVIKMELCHGTLQDYLISLKSAEKNIDAHELTTIMIHILTGLRHCHDLHYCHRDLKLANVLYVNNSCSCHPDELHRRWLLTDFGFSVVVQSGKDNLSKYGRGTPGYRAPELQESNYTESGQPSSVSFSKKSDIWAIGCILYALASTGVKSAFPSDSVAYWYAHGEIEVPQLNSTSNPNLVGQYGMSAPIWIKLNDIIKVCLSPLPEDRPSASELLTQFHDIGCGIQNCVKT